MFDRSCQQLIRTLGSRANKGRLCVVNYHRILAAKNPLLDCEPDLATFRWQMALLARSFNVLPLYEAVQLLGSRRMPPRAVSITFDDGYRSVHELALPVLQQWRLPATVFVASGFVSGGAMWNDLILDAVQHLPQSHLDLRDLNLGMYSLATLAERKHAVRSVTNASKYLPQAARQALSGRLERLVGGHVGQSLMLTPGMLVELDRAGVEIGAHTITHPILTSIGDDDARHEIEGGKHALEAIIGKPVRLFAYPNGKAGKDFDERHSAMAARAGFVAAFTTHSGAAGGQQDRYALPRSRPWDRTPLMFGLRLLRWLSWDPHRIANAPAPANTVLMTAFHFPPQAASSGIQRTLSFSRHLGGNGWQPLVLSASARAYGEQNASQLASVPPGLVVRRAFALDAKRHLGVRGRYPEVLALPDRWASWWLAAVPAGLALIRAHRPQVIWSTFPIATSHLIALTLHRLTGLPWVADFRDPMLQASYPVSRLQRWAFGWIERQAIEHCSAAVFTTHSARTSTVERFPWLPSSKFSVIENGYDEDGFKTDKQAAVGQPGVTTLVHSGILYDSGRDPSPFFEALAALKARGEINHRTLRVVLRAPGELDAMRALANTCEVGDIVAVEPPVAYGEALREMLSADALIVFQGTAFNTQIPAKMYEYFRARKPILGLVDVDGETAQVLRAAGFDAIADIDDSAAIATVLARLLGQLRCGAAHVASERLIAASSRTHRAAQLAGIFTQAARHGG